MSTDNLRKWAKNRAIILRIFYKWSNCHKTFYTDMWKFWYLLYECRNFFRHKSELTFFFRNIHFDQYIGCNVMFSASLSIVSANRTESTEWIRSTLSIIYLTLLRCIWPIICSGYLFGRNFIFWKRVPVLLFSHWHEHPRSYASCSISTGFCFCLLRST